MTTKINARVEVEEHALRGTFQQQHLPILQQPAHRSIASIDAHDDGQTRQVAMDDVAVETELHKIGGQEMTERYPQHTGRSEEQARRIRRHERPQAPYDAYIIDFAVAFVLSSGTWRTGRRPLLAVALRPHLAGTWRTPCGEV